MKEFIDKLIGRLEEIYNRNDKQKKEAYEEQDWEYFDLFTHRNEGIYSAIAIVNQLAEEYKSKDCSECSRRKFYQQGYEDAKKEYINTSTDTSSDTSITNAEWKQHILNRFEGGSV